MPRPTFTASDVARYTYCNLAWSYEVQGVVPPSPEEVRRELTTLQQKPARSPEEEQELRYLQAVARNIEKRDAGVVHHAEIHAVATTHGVTARRAFAVALTVGFVLLLVLYLLL